MLLFATCFIILKLTANIEGADPRTVNLELETVLAFDNKDNFGNVKFIDDVQNFLNTVRKAVNQNTSQRRSFGTTNNFKFIDFVKKLLNVLKNYQDDDLEDVFAVMDDEIRKYHYKGCKFYELVKNVDLRRSVAVVLDIVKEKPANIIRKNLDKTLQFFDNPKFDSKQTEMLDYLNSLFTKENGLEFNKILEKFQIYQSKSKRANLDLINLVRDSLRTTIFDHYSQLNKNIRNDLKEKIENFYLSLKKERNTKSENTQKVWTIEYKNIVEDDARNLRQNNNTLTPLVKNESINVSIEENLKKPIKSHKRNRPVKNIDTNEEDFEETFGKNNEKLLGRDLWFNTKITTTILPNKIPDDDLDVKRTVSKKPNIFNKNDKKDNEDLDDNNVKYPTRYKKRPKKNKKEKSNKDDESNEGTETKIQNKHFKNHQLTTPRSINANIRDFIRSFKIKFLHFGGNNVDRSKKITEHGNDEMPATVTSYLGGITDKTSNEKRRERKKRVKTDSTTKRRLHTLWEEKITTKKHRRKKERQDKKSTTKTLGSGKRQKVKEITPENESRSHSRNQNKHTTQTKLRKSKKKTKRTSKSKRKRHQNTVNKKKSKENVSKFELKKEKETKLQSLYVGESEESRQHRKQKKKSNHVKKSIAKKKTNSMSRDVTDETAEEFDISTIKQHVRQTSTEESNEGHKKVKKHVSTKKHHKANEKKKIKKYSSKKIKSTTEISTDEEEHTTHKRHKTDAKSKQYSLKKSPKKSDKSLDVKPAINIVEDGMSSNNIHMKALSHTQNSRDEMTPSHTAPLSEEGMSIETNEVKNETPKHFMKQPKMLDRDVEKENTTFEKSRRQNINNTVDKRAFFNSSEYLIGKNLSAERNRKKANLNKINDNQSYAQQTEASINRFDISYKHDMIDVNEDVKKSLNDLGRIVNTESSKLDIYPNILRDDNYTKAAESFLNRIDFLDKQDMKMASEELENSLRKMSSFVNITKTPESNVYQNHLLKKTVLSIENDEFDKNENKINYLNNYTKQTEPWTRINPLDRPVIKTENAVSSKFRNKITDNTIFRADSVLNQAGTLEQSTVATDIIEKKSTHEIQSSVMKIVTKFPILDFWQSTTETTKIKPQPEKTTTLKTTSQKLAIVTKNDNTILKDRNTSKSKHGTKRKRKKKKKARTDSNEAVTGTTTRAEKSTKDLNKTYNNKEMNDTAIIKPEIVVRTQVEIPTNSTNELGSSLSKQNAKFELSSKRNVDMILTTPEDLTPTEAADDIMQNLLDKYDIATVAVDKHFKIENIQSALATTKTDVKSLLKEEDSKVRVNRDMMKLFGHTVSHHTIQTVPANTLFTDAFDRLDTLDLK